MASDIDGLRYTTLLYGTGPGHSEPRALPLNTTASAAASADAVHAAAVPRQWATHGGEDVPIYALGKMLPFLLIRVIRQPTLGFLCLVSVLWVQYPHGTNIL